MKPISLAAFALLLGAGAVSAGYGQAPPYDPPPGPSPRYEQGYDHDEDYEYEEHRPYRAAPSPRFDVGFFFDELSPYGDWILTRDHGWAWFPRDVRPNWRPYSDGRWVNSDYGWTWASYEPFGWATYHYGRWAWDSRIGWLWVPGTVWGPAWVSWQHGGGYVGWAPLPPSVGYEIGIGLRFGRFDLSFGLQPDSYSFVSERSFLEPRLSGYLIPTARNGGIIYHTTNITNYTWIDNRVVNRGVDVRRIEEVIGRRLRSLRVAQAGVKNRTEVAESEVRIFRPERRQLESVQVGRRANSGLRIETPPAERDRNRITAEPLDDREIKVAPRANKTQHSDARQVEKQERSAHQELERYQLAEQRRLEKIQQQEIDRTDERAERNQVEKHHQAERTAQQLEQRNATQQLDARQQAQRQASQRSDREAVEKPSQSHEKKESGKTQKNEDGGGLVDEPKTQPPSVDLKT